ncbi:MAG: GtrA family protein [Leclercia sp.]
MFKLFTKYASIGVLNTAMHWIIFSICVYAFHTSQALANVVGFAVAVSFSFFANARFTFKSTISTTRYLLYVGFMGALSGIVGWIADECAMVPIITLVIFSAISLICGFFYSRFIVFRKM